MKNLLLKSLDYFDKGNTHEGITRVINSSDILKIKDNKIYKLSIFGDEPLQSLMEDLPVSKLCAINSKTSDLVIGYSLIKEDSYISYIVTDNDIFYIDGAKELTLFEVDNILYVLYIRDDTLYIRYELDKFVNESFIKRIKPSIHIHSVDASKNFKIILKSNEKHEIENNEFKD